MTGVEGFISYAKGMDKYAGAGVLPLTPSWTFKFSYVHPDRHYVKRLMTCFNGGKQFPLKWVPKKKDDCETLCAVTNGATHFARKRWPDARIWDTEDKHRENAKSWQDRSPCIAADHLGHLLDLTESYFVKSKENIPTPPELSLLIATYPFRRELDGFALEEIPRLLTYSPENHRKVRTIMAHAFALLQQDEAQADRLWQQIEKLSTHPIL
jgi:hypothetical protein